MPLAVTVPLNNNLVADIGQAVQGALFHPILFWYILFRIKVSVGIKNGSVGGIEISITGNW